MKTTLAPAWSIRVTCVTCVAGAALLTALAATPAYAADSAASASTGEAPCGLLVGPDPSGGTQHGFALRDGEAVDFVAGGQTTHGKLLVFSDGSLFRAYWQPQGSEEKYALANAGPHGVRLVSTPPQGSPAPDGKPGIMSQPLQVLSCPKM